MSDRTYVFTTLLLGLIGSVFLIDYRTRNLNHWQVFIGFTLLAIAVIIGKQVTNNMFSKLIGSNMNRSYLTFSLLIVCLTRMCAPFLNIHFLETGGLLKLMGMAAGLYLAGLLFMTLGINALTPHYSYLIEKQKEMLLKGYATNKDIRILETPEYQAIPMHLND